MRAVLLNGGRINFDGNLSFGSIMNVVNDLIEYEETEPDQVLDRVGSCDILITKEILLTKGTINSLPKTVTLICEAGTGVDNINLEAAEARSISVCNVPNYSTTHVGQLTLNFILLLSSGMYGLAQGKGELGNWKQTRISEVNGKSLGVIGAGAIGMEVIRLARAFEMNIHVYSRSTRHWEDQNIRQASLGEVLSSSDFLSLHCPLNKVTRHLIRSETISMMKRGSYIINTARGGLIDHDDLARAIQSGHIAGAALDVQEPEPLPSSSILRAMGNVVLTNHIGWKAIEARQRLITTVAKNIQEYGRTGIPMNRVISS